MKQSRINLNEFNKFQRIFGKESTFQRVSDLSDNSVSYKRFHFYGTFGSVNRLPLMNTIEFEIHSLTKTLSS